MALPLANTFEGGTDETTVTTGNSGGASGDAFDVVTITAGALVFDTARAAHGGLSARVDVVSNLANVEWRAASTGGDWTQVWGRVYVYFTANPANTIRLVGIFNSAGTRMADVSVQSGGFLRVSDSAFTSDDSVGTILLNQWTRIEFTVLHSATVGVIEAKIFSADALTPITNGTVTSPATRNTGTGAQRASFGQAISNVQTTTFWMDSIQINSTGYPGPLLSRLTDTHWLSAVGQ